MNPILFMLSVFGTIAVCLCFVLLLPAVGQTLAVLFGAVYGEKASPSSINNLRELTSGIERHIDLGRIS